MDLIFYHTLYSNNDSKIERKCMRVRKPNLGRKDVGIFT